MKNDRKRLPLLLLATLALAAGAPGDHVAFHPGAGSSLTKTFTMESELELQKLTANMNGNEIDSKATSGMEMTTSATQTVTVTDTYVTLGDGRPTKLKRTFDGLSSKTEVSMSNAVAGEVPPQNLDGESALEGLTVEFVWDDGEDDYRVAFAEGSKGEHDLLDGLREDTDLRDFLPAGEVETGASWSVDPDALRNVLAPGGAVKIEPTSKENMAGMQGQQPSMDEMLGDFEGTLQATYAGTRDEGGTKVAVIKLAVEVSTAKDVTKAMQESMKGAEIPGGGSLDLESMDIEFEFKGEGELHWNLESGVLHSLSLAGQSGMTIDTALKFDMQGRSGRMETSMVLSGSQSITVASE